VGHSERGEGNVPEAQQPPAKGTVAAEKFLAMKPQADHRAADEGRENQPPTGIEIELVRHVMPPGHPSSFNFMLCLVHFLLSYPELFTKFPEGPIFVRQSVCA
jgi:hypothetical protein